MSSWLGDDLAGEIADIHVKNTFIHVGMSPSMKLCHQRSRSAPEDMSPSRCNFHAANVQGGSPSRRRDAWADQEDDHDDCFGHLKVPGAALVTAEHSSSTAVGDGMDAFTGDNTVSEMASVCSRDSRSGSFETCDDGTGAAAVPAGETRTTVMIRSLPENFTRQQLEDLLGAEGFASCFDFMYVPADIVSGGSFFYAFVNLVNPQEAQRFRDHFTGFTRWPVPCSTAAAVDWSEALQGIDALIERYRNSPLMHHRVPDRLRPALYSNGVLVEFPTPTQQIKAPRLRRESPSKQRREQQLQEQQQQEEQGQQRPQQGEVAASRVAG